MEKRPPRPMTLFDELTMPPQFRMMKLMLPYTPAATRPMLAILIKFMELQHTIQLFSNHPDALSPSKGHTGTQGFSLHMIEEILPYLSPQEQEMFENMRNMMNMMEMMQMMQQMQEPQKTPETQGEPSNDTQNTDSFHSFGDTSAQNNVPAFDMTNFSGLNPMDLLQNMLPPGQQEMFRTYQNIFEQNISEQNTSEQNVSEQNIPEQNMSEMEGEDSHE